MPPEKVLTFKELNDIWYPVNTRINFLTNFNLRNHDTTWKLKRYLLILNQIFPLDPTIHLALSKCYEIEDSVENKRMAKKFLDDAEKEMFEQKYWSKLFEHCKKFDQHKIIPERFN